MVIRWGIIGLGEIAEVRCITDEAPPSRVVDVGARDSKRE